MNKSLSIAQAIKAQCRECCNNHNQRTHCVSTSCPLFPYKCGKKETNIPKMIECTKDLILRENLSKNWEKTLNKEQIFTRLQAIKERCKDCAFEGDVKNCIFKDCPLYPYRFGKNQTLAKKMVSPEKKSILLNNLKNKARGGKNE